VEQLTIRLYARQHTVAVLRNAYALLCIRGHKGYEACLEESGGLWGRDQADAAL
jgi:hypothetical protein